MDTQELQTLADSKFNHLIFRKNLKERVAAQLATPHGGGLFVASKELIAFLQIWDTEELVLEDMYGNPIKCLRLQLLSDLKQAYQYAMNAWHVEFEQSKKIRKAVDV